MKQTTQHTPGPWRLKYINRSASVEVIGGEQFHHVCKIDGKRAESHFQAGNANASLIAAAPDLLEALHGFLDLYDQGQLQIDGDDGHDPLVKAARAAIAKATQA